MFSHHLASSFRPTLCAARCASRRLPAHRALSSTSRLFAETDGAEPSSRQGDEAALDIDFAPSESAGGSGSGPTTYQEFLDQVAWRYRNAEPLNWLSEKGVSRLGTSRRHSG